ncbi:hypothetical protein [Bacillus thuringiensis]|uniref:Cell wall surface anchor family protein n=1 Tax=Bacillus thuringiensis HD-771 TaxID=1218175 RepID=A0A9W3JDW3_BACTU|nr:cell wall surface anchor family protein [Bacillus thuringiensis HD-771]EOO11064.1 hypothetical protein IAW_00074 [Bacillus cereus str. Schrouff]EOO90594.1 hypothetical protein IGY_00694 [Bacillus cereus K-5975c]MRB35199.1 cell surface protein [Bacillus thuringiensis]PGN02674.1 cell surface protein [Bacillus cereus]
MRKKILPICAMALLSIGYSSLASASTGTTSKGEVSAQALEKKEAEFHAWQKEALEKKKAAMQEQKKIIRTSRSRDSGSTKRSIREKESNDSITTKE